MLLVEHAVAEELELSDRLFNIIRNWKQTEPVVHEVCLIVGIGLNNCSLILDNFSNACDCVIPCMLEASQLILPSLDLGSDLILDAPLQRIEANIRARLEGIASVLRYDSDSVS